MKMKRFFVTLLTVSLIITALPMTAFAEGNEVTPVVAKVYYDGDSEGTNCDSWEAAEGIITTDDSKDVRVEILENGTYTTNFKLPGHKNVIIEGKDGVVLDGQIAMLASDGRNGKTPGSLTLKNLTFNVDSNISDSADISQTSLSAIALWGDQSVVCDNVTFEMSLGDSTAITGWWDTGIGTSITVNNCTFNCNGQRPIRACGNVTVDNCIFNDPYRYAVQLTGKADTAEDMKQAVITFKNNKINNGEHGKAFVYGVQLEGADYGCKDLKIIGTNNTIDAGEWDTDNRSTMFYCECGLVKHNTIVWDIECAPTHENCYVVTYESDYGKAPDWVVIEKDAADKKVTLPAAPSADDKVFLGWELDGVVYQPADKVEISADTTFVAQWAVAKIEENNYASLEDAFDAVTAEASTILLVDNVTSSDKLEITKDFAITLDLGGNTLSQRINLRKGELTVKNGKIKAVQALNVYGSETDVANYSVLTVADDVEIDADYCVCVFPNNNENMLGYGIVVNMNSSNAAGTLFVSGNLGNTAKTAAEMSASANAPVIYINSGAMIDGADVSKGQGVAINGYAKVYVENGAKIIGNEAVGIKRGELIVDGGEFIANGEAPEVVYANGSGTEASGAAVSMTGTYNYSAPLKVTINGGKFTSANRNALFVGHSVDKGTEKEIPFKEGWAVTVKGGEFSSKSGKPAVFIAEKIEEGDNQDFAGYTQEVISGGYFTSDPGAYVVSGKASVISDKTGYEYMVAEKGEDVIIDKPATTETQGSVSESIAPADVTAATEIASSVSADNAITEAAKKTTLTDAEKQAVVDEVKEELGSDGEDIIIYKQTYLEVETKELTKVNDEITEIALEITPKMQIVASTAKTADSINETNSVAVGEAEDLTITKEVEITVTLPEAFAGKTVHIKHLAKNGNTYFYTATVDSDGVVTFTSKYGFSPFTFSTKSEAVAEIGDIGYPTLQAAVDDVANNGTIKVLVNNLSAAVSSVKTFTVEKGEGVDTVTITAGSGYSLKQTDNTYTVTKIINDGSNSPSGGGTTSKQPVDKPEVKPEDKPIEPEDIPAEEKIVLTVNLKEANVFGKPVVNDVAPVIREDRTMLPIRFVAEALGATVDWDGTLNKVTITKGETVIEITINSAVALVNGKAVELDSPAFIENSRTYLPLRFVAENLGAAVYWNGETKVVTVVPTK